MYLYDSRPSAYSVDDCTFIHVLLICDYEFMMFIA